MKVETLRQWLEAGRRVTVLDVRPVEQRKEWSIPGSIHADVYDALKRDDAGALKSLDLPKDIPVITVCAMGKTSRKAAEILSEIGLDSDSLDGGMQAWSSAWNTAEIPLGRSDAFAIQIRRVGKGCLSYLIGSNGVAAIIDPSVDSEVYLKLAEEKSVKIIAVLDTHIHADHISRSLTLAKLADAKRYLPAESGVTADGYLADGDVVAIGSINLTAVRTPGHTPESTCYRLEDNALFTGDTLFLNAVGRPDLAVGADVSQQARNLYASLRRLVTLPGSLRILPAHHSVPPGFDGKPITASLAEVKAENPFLRKDEEEFVNSISSAVLAPPPNHLQIVEINKAGKALEGDWMTLESGPNRCAVP